MKKMIHFPSPIGPIHIVGSEKGISQVLLAELPSSTSPETSPWELLVRAKSQVLEYLDGKRKSFDIALDIESIKGFQKDVLAITLAIPYGEVLTYGQIAKMLGKPNASRAVGGALSRNPIPIIIPCHRVIAASGALTGYTGAGGIATKEFLLVKEGHRVVAQKLV